MDITRVPVTRITAVVLIGNLTLLAAIPAIIGVSFGQPGVDRRRKPLDAGPDAGLLRVRATSRGRAGRRRSCSGSQCSARRPAT